MQEIQERIRQQLFALSDEKYRRFQSALMPDVDPEKVIGVRTPLLRGIAENLKNDAETENFLCSLPHKYYEENNLHALLIMRIKDFERCIRQVDRFLPFVDNWATCDMLRPECFKKHKAELRRKISVWLASENTFTVRFGIEMLMVHFLDDCFTQEIPETVSRVRSGDYYVNTMQAWFFAEALAKQYESAVRFIEEKRLPEPVHGMTIQKAVESLRIPPERKAHLKQFKTKKQKNTGM